jgi:flagellar hook assembly protein FlgD
MKKVPLKQFSKKKQEQNNKLREVYEKIKKVRPERCEGCGQRNFLSFSHLIPRSRNEDFITDEDNIRIHCMQREDGSKGCHSRWEGKLEEKQTLMDFEYNMEFIKAVDEEYYNLIMNK